MRRIVMVLVVLALLAIPAAAAGPEDDVELEKIIDGLSYPLYLTHAGDGSGRLFIVLQTGEILIYKDGALLDAPFLDLSGVASQNVLQGYSERGLLGLAFHPDYAENGRFFVDYTAQNGGTTVVAEYAVLPDDPDRADPDSARELFTVAQPFSNHNGGHLAFGPDGYLYVAMGDGGSAGDPDGNGQNPFTLLGTILRIDVDAGEPYAIPADNPFADGAAGAPEVWAWGLRNPWRFSFDHETGDLYIGDVGQNAWEEIDFQPAGSTGGENYGWNIFEATQVYTTGSADTGLVWPIVEYGHDVGCSVTGGYVYRGEALPSLQGAYVYGDWCTGNTWLAFRDDGGEWQSAPFLATNLPVSSFGEDEAGELYLIDYSAGAIYKFVPAG